MRNTRPSTDAVRHTLASLAVKPTLSQLLALDPQRRRKLLISQRCAANTQNTPRQLSSFPCGREGVRGRRRTCKRRALQRASVLRHHAGRHAEPQRSARPRAAAETAAGPAGWGRSASAWPSCCATPLDPAHHRSTARQSRASPPPGARAQLSPASWPAASAARHTPPGRTPGVPCGGRRTGPSAAPRALPARRGRGRPYSRRLSPAGPHECPREARRVPPSPHRPW